jgi:hypothetical protein
VTTTRDPLLHVLKHVAATNVLPDQHHLRPLNISIANTTQAITPLPGGPTDVDFSVPFDAKVARLILRSSWQTNDVGGKAGGHWIVTRTAYLDAAGMCIGGPSAWQSGGYFGAFSKPATSIDLSPRVFDSGGNVALRDAYLAQTGASTRVLRTSWVNYGASYYTIYAVGEIHILG